LAGLVFVGFGLAFALGALTYDVGSTLRMGPGYFPLVLGGLLVVLGGIIAVRGFVEEDAAPFGSVPWRALLLVLGAVVLFGLTVRGLGLVPSIFLASMLSAFASERTGVIGALVIAAGLTTICILVFVVALSLRLPLLGPWLPF
ncbi:MAG TPA: tripartite tricarboxylate transporter TctB family protein, partial [Candidatus Limnocylindrales bacterium]|nr:tripartite tricarboxylate transporter TctB family protein [Candidatus Limnocylindrales bacterium]